MNPDDVISYNNRGLAHEKNGEYELALEDYTKAIELEPNEVSAPANYVPAAAVIRREQALSGITGRKGCVGGYLSQM